MALKTALRGISLLTVLGFVYGLVRLASAPGGTRSRLLFFGLLVALACLGLAGILLDAAGLSVLSGALLLGIGFTQAVLFAYLLPTGTVLLVAGLALWVPSPAGNSEGPQNT